MYPQNFYNSPFQTSQQVIRVTGEGGARAYTLPPNSSALLLDDTAPIVWLVQTDGAGYKTLSPYKIEPYSPAPEPDMNSIIERINRLEEALYESNTAGNSRKQSEQLDKPTKRAQQPAGLIRPNAAD